MSKKAEAWLRETAAVLKAQNAGDDARVERIVRHNRETCAHVDEVRGWMYAFEKSLDERAVHHDASKYYEPEVSGFIDMADELALSEQAYGSPEYRAILKKYHDAAIGHHYEHNDHHPEHFIGNIDRIGVASAEERDVVKSGMCLSKMTIPAIIEMLCDWRAASERMAYGGDFPVSMWQNRERFGIGSQLFAILWNTAATVGMFGDADPNEEWVVSRQRCEDSGKCSGGG